MRFVRVVLVAIVFANATAALSQQALNWSADDGARIESLAKKGDRIERANIVLWFPPSLPRAEADALATRLDSGVAVLRKRVGVHAWQLVPKERITFYTSDDTFISHASGRAAVFLPMARVKDGRAPYLHEATHELLASSIVQPGPPRRDGEPVRRPLWLMEGLPEYIAQLVAAETGVAEPGPFAEGGLAGVDGTCAERTRTTDGATMLPYIGSVGVPEVLFTTDRSRFAPTFYACAFSFTKFLAGRIGLEALIGVMGVPPGDATSAIERATGRSVAELRSDWQRALANREGPLRLR